MVDKRILSAFLVVVFLTSSIYFMMPDKVRIDIGKTNTKYSVWENESWVLAATEYVNLYDGTTKMRAKSRNLNYWNDSYFAYVTRTSTWKDNITTIQTYTFDKYAEDVEIVPINNIVQCINCEGKILHYEIRDILYYGITEQIQSPFSFEHNMEIEWQDGAYYSKVFQQKSSDKIIVKFRPTQSDQSFYLRLFDPIYYYPGTTTVCYQESANTTNQTGIDSPCALNYSGNYGLEDNYFNINYTKPKDLSSAEWRVKHGRLGESNNTIPLSCINYDEDVLMLRFYSSWSVSTSSPASYGQCYDGSWNTITSVSTLGSGGPCSSGSISDVPYDGNFSNAAIFETTLGWKENVFVTEYCTDSAIWEEGIYWTIKDLQEISTINIELGSQLNLTTNLTGASTVCVDIDHPEYGDNYTCGSPTANFTFNISYFRNTEFNDSTTVKTANSTYTFVNGTIYDGGSYIASSPREWCAEYQVNTHRSKLEISYSVRFWSNGVEYVSDEDVPPQITIRDSNRELLETIIDIDWIDSAATDSVVSNDFYYSGLYGFCIKIPFAEKFPVTNDTSYDVYYSSSVYAMYGKVTMGFNYYANRSTTHITHGWGPLNSIKHKFVYQDATFVWVQKDNLPGGTHTFDNPNTSKTLDYVEIWAWTRNAGPGQIGMVIDNSSIFYLITEACLNGTQTSNCNGGNFRVNNDNNDGVAYTVTGGTLSKAPHITTSNALNSLFYISSHYFDEVKGFTLNITGIETASDVKIYINDTLTNSLGTVYNTSEGNISSVAETEFTLISPNSTTFSIPKSAVVTNATLNFTGGNITWEIGEYLIPINAYGVLGSPSIGTPYWRCSGISDPNCEIPYTAWDGTRFTGAFPYLEPLYDSDYTAYIYENYTIDSNYIFANWSAYFSSGNTIVFVQDCFNNVSWVNMITDTDEYFNEPNVISAPSTCLEQSVFQVRTTLQYAPTTQFVYTSNYQEGLINYYRNGYPEDLIIQVGTPDGTPEYQGSGELTGSDSIANFVGATNTYLSTCTADSDGFCDVPIYFISQDGGSLTIDNIEILYTYNPNPVTISASVIQSFLDSSLIGFVDIPIIITMESGSLSISDLRYDYAGGNDTIEVLSYDANATIDCYQETANESHSSDTNGCHALNYTGNYNIVDSYFYINYSKPLNVASAKWKVQHGEESPYNVSILSTCFSQPQIMLRFFSNVTGTWNTISYGECYNGTWNLITGNFTAANGGTEGATSGDHSALMYDGEWDTHAGWSGSYSPFGLNWYKYGDAGGINWTSRIFEEAIIWENVSGQSDKDNGNTLNIINYYSDYSSDYPALIEWLEFIPISLTEKNVAPYGQTPINPIYNITNNGYGGMQSNFSVYLNETHSCVNLTISTTNNKSDGFILNSTWTDISIDFDYLNSTSIWMWADLECSYSTWSLWFPDFYFRNCCEDCICWESLV